MLPIHIADQLKAIVGVDYVLTSPEDLLCYSYDATPKGNLPDAVVFPVNADEIAEVLRLANSERVPIVPRGSGTNLSGGSVPVQGGIVLVVKRLDQVLEIDEENLTATVQPGVILADFQRAVENKGLFYPPDPSSLSVATLGGTIAEGAGGPRGFKYGTTKDFVIGLEVVLATGERIKTGGKTVKNVSGYDLTHLFVGAEGTLGIVTEITVRLLPLPEAKETCLAIFATIDDAAKAVSAIIRSRILPTALELLDDMTMKCIETYKPVGLPLDAEAALLIEVDGSKTEVPLQLEKVLEACRRFGAKELRVAKNEAERDKIWLARRSAYGAIAQVRPAVFIEDATVPRQSIPEMVRAVKEAAKKHNVQVGLLAHAGDGNMHPSIMCDTNDADEMARVQRFTEDIFKVALSLGGTLTGEHGIGLIKAPFLTWQFGQQGWRTMWNIKKTLDPNNILNPGKVFWSKEVGQ